MLTEFAGRTAVVTGGASGIGFAMARRCADRGMNVAILDVEANALTEAAAQLNHAAPILSLTVDTANGTAMDAAGEKVADRFGAVHLLSNNAGVSITGPMWAMTEDDCRWATGVNLLGVMNGVRTFVPRMLEGGDEGHVVNTASLVGLLPMPETPLYAATKAAVIAMSEAMFFDLADRGGRIGVSVLCPGIVNTNIMDSNRNRPDNLSTTGALSDSGLGARRRSHWRRPFERRRPGARCCRNGKFLCPDQPGRPIRYCRTHEGDRRSRESSTAESGVSSTRSFTNVIDYEAGRTRPSRRRTRSFGPSPRWWLI